MTYGETRARLETRCGFGAIFSTRMGKAGGAMQDEILAWDLEAEAALSHSDGCGESGSLVAEY